MKIPLHELPHFWINPDPPFSSAVNAFGHSFHQCYVLICFCTREELEVIRRFCIVFSSKCVLPQIQISLRSLKTEWYWLFRTVGLQRWNPERAVSVGEIRGMVSLRRLSVSIPGYHRALDKWEMWIQRSPFPFLVFITLTRKKLGKLQGTVAVRVQAAL